MISVWGLLDPASETYKKFLTRSTCSSQTHTSTTQAAPKREIFIGAGCPESCSLRDGMRSGSTARSRRSTGRTWGMAFCATSNWPLAMARSTPMCFRFCNSRSAGYWKATTESKRVFLLTRSAFLGQQRVGATVWSGSVRHLLGVESPGTGRPQLCLVRLSVLDNGHWRLLASP